jgi:dihydrofolate reductase
MYETMAVWDTIDDPQPQMRDFAEIWRAADKIVYSTTLDAPTTARTTLERAFDPGAIQRLKDDAEHDLAIGGPGLAQHAFAAGLVDDIYLFVAPTVVGGGKPALPRDVRIPLELTDERRFENGTVYLQYRTV